MVSRRACGVFGELISSQSQLGTSHHMLASLTKAPYAYLVLSVVQPVRRQRSVGRL